MNYRQRVVRELAVLTESLTKLHSFLKSQEKVRTPDVNDKELELLHQQCEAMSKHQLILIERLDIMLD